MYLFQHFHQVLGFKLPILQSLVCFFNCSPLRQIFYTILTSFLSVLSLWNLFKPASLPLNIKPCSAYVTVSFSVLFQINYASVWHHRFRAKTNSFLSLFSSTKEETEVTVHQYWINCPRAKGLNLKIHRCSPGTSKFIQIHWHGARLRMFNRLLESNKAVLIYL